MEFLVISICWYLIIYVYIWDFGGIKREEETFIRFFEIEIIRDGLYYFFNERYI